VLDQLNLIEFWFNNNQIESFEELESLKHMNQLQAIFLYGNPIEKNPQYRNKIILELQSLTEIDSTPVVKSSIVDVLRNK